AVDVDVDGAALPVVLDRIVQQVVEDLTQFVGVGFQRGRVIALNAQLEPLRLRQRLDHRDALPRQVGGIDRLASQPIYARIEARQRQQPFDRLVNLLPARLAVLQGLAVFAGRARLAQGDV